MDGDRYEALLGVAEQNYFLHDFATDYWLTKIPICARGEGSWVWDADGERRLDLMGGLWYKAIGYGRREVADAMHRYMLNEPESVYAFSAAPVQLELAQRLARLCGLPDGRVYFTSGGSESNETAVKMACRYQQLGAKPRAYKVVARRGSYHGSTGLCVSMGQVATADTMGVTMPGVVNVVNWDSYRLPFEGAPDAVARRCADEFEKAIVDAGADSVAAMIAEPISAATGVHVPPPIYWRRLREIADKYDVVLIADEVITGFGRTGAAFGLMHWGVQADITTVAKALTSGYAPLGAAIASRRVADAFIGGDDKQFRHILTFGGHPVSCAAAMANLDIMESEDLFARAAARTPQVRAALDDLAAKHAIIGDIRGVGLLWALELVKDRAAKERFPAELNLRILLYKTLAKNGLTSFRTGNVLPLCPPLTISDAELEFMFDALDKSVGEVEAEILT